MFLKCFIVYYLKKKLKTIIVINFLMFYNKKGKKKLNIIPV